MKVAGIIPARYESTRLPGKPLAKIGGKSLIIRVIEQCKRSKLLNEIVVATDDQRIFDHVISAGNKVVMTSRDHTSGTERCQEALGKIEGEFDFVINIQGDEPFINPEHIDKLINSLNSSTEVATLCMPIENSADLNDKSIPKLVLNNNMEVMYFSRALIPFIRDENRSSVDYNFSYLKHIGIYAYRKDILATIVKLPSSQLEMAEQLEQLRWLVSGIKIKAETVKHEVSISVDTIDDLDRANKYVKENSKL